MVLMMVTTPLQLVHLDFTSFKMAMNLNESPKVKHILVNVDLFMRYTRANVTNDQKALMPQRSSTKGSFPFLEHPKEYSWIKEKPSPVR